jgi:hypothetical protein
MDAEPADQRLRRGVLQQVDDVMSRRIHQDSVESNVNSVIHSHGVVRVNQGSGWEGLGCPEWDHASTSDDRSVVLAGR